MTIFFAKPKPVLFWWALAFWTVSVALSWLDGRFGWCRDLKIYIASLIVLPWHALLSLWLVYVFPKRIHGLWIVPLLLVGLAVGCWFMLLAELRALNSHFVHNALDIASGAGRESFWITLYTLPCAVVPIAFYLFWPRVWPQVAAPVCSQCGYDLRGSAASERCPECGKVITLGQDFPTPSIE